MDIELPSGHKVTVRDTVSNRARKMFLDAVEHAPSVEVKVRIPVLDANEQPVLDPETNEPMFTVQLQEQTTWTGTLNSIGILIAMLVVSWDFTDGQGNALPIPDAAHIDRIDDLDTEDFDCISKAIDPIIERAFPQFRPTMKKEDDEGNEAPSLPSSE